MQNLTVEKMQLLYVDGDAWARPFFPEDVPCTQLSLGVESIRQFVVAARASGYEPTVIFDGMKTTENDVNERVWHRRRKQRFGNNKWKLLIGLKKLMVTAFQSQGVQVLFSCECDRTHAIAAMPS